MLRIVVDRKGTFRLGIDVSNRGDQSIQKDQSSQRSKNNLHAWPRPKLQQPSNREADQDDPKRDSKQQPLLNGSSSRNKYSYDGKRCQRHDLKTLLPKSYHKTGQ